MYNHAEIEKKWQEFWAKNKTYAVLNDAPAPRVYVLDMFPYPSAAGLHVGHPEGYTASDILTRYLKHTGASVLHPMGWDAFGLPAENYALKMKRHPREITDESIFNFKKQIQSLGFAYDWDREINTTDPKYYKWTQWIFLQLFKKGLAYEKEAPINWCPSCHTGVANEEVENGRHEKCETEVSKKMLKQWYLKITAYADRLLNDLDRLAWPERIKTMQKNWVGKSEGFEFALATENSEEKISVYTTRLDTLFGLTYVVLAPENDLVSKIVSAEQKNEVEKYVKASVSKLDKERMAEAKDKTGIFTGAYALHPFTGEKLPIWVADYVLGSYGTGAVMAVPAHDERDYEFAKKYGLEIKEVIKGGLTQNSELIRQPTDQNSSFDMAYEGEGNLFDSGEFSDLTSAQARQKIGEVLQAKKIGDFKINYKLRDWLFSRQRYWGEPIPLVHCEKCGVVPVDEKDLPVLLPEVESYEPSGTGESPLAKITEWVNVKCPQCGAEAKRETNTMPQWAGSSWYHLRYLDPHNDKELVNKKIAEKWLPIAQYVGGAEHAVLHLLYARFWHKFLCDIDAVPKVKAPDGLETDEPYWDLKNQGLILGKDGEKMSKSKGNVVNPDDVIVSLGADTLRCFEMFLGPFEDAKPWNDESILGIRRFLERFYNVFSEKKMVERSLEGDLAKIIHATIKKVTSDIQNWKFNTALSQLMVCLKALQDEVDLPQEAARAFIILLEPFAPHLAWEMWAKHFASEDLAVAPWPLANEKFLVANEVLVVIQVNGKKRGEIMVATGATEAEVMTALKNDAKIAKYLTGEISKSIFVSDKLLNLVI